MTTLESKTVELKKTPAEVYSFLTDFSNFQNLMPPQVTDWKQDAEGVSFNIKGMASLGLTYGANVPHSEVVMQNRGKAPFDFRIITKIEEAGTGSKARIVMEADMNPFIKMMAEKPLGNFLNMLADKMQELL